MTGHAVVIAGGGPTGLMLAGELALTGADAAIVERRASPDLTGSRAGGLHSRTIEVLDQRGIAERFLSQGQVAQVAYFSGILLDISDFPTRHNYGLGLWQDRIERTLAGWVGELAVPVYRGREVTGFAQDGTGVDVELSDGQPLWAEYLVGCDGGRSLIRKAAGIEFPGWDPSTSSLVSLPGGRRTCMPGLQQAEIGAPAADRHDFTVQDHRDVDPAGEYGQLGITARHVLAGAGDQPDHAAVDIGDRAHAIPLELPPVPVVIVWQRATQAGQHRPDQPRHSPPCSIAPWGILYPKRHITRPDQRGCERLVRGWPSRPSRAT
jgi:flavin-dependent dehydrogenase